MIGRLKLNDVLIPGTVMNIKRIDFDDPKNSDIKDAFEETKNSQNEVKELVNIDPSVFNLVITI